MLVCCSKPDPSQPVSIVWKDEKAVGLVIRKVYAKDEDLPQLQVRLVKEGDRTAVLGEFKHNLSDISFTPVVSLTRGLTYEILEDGIVFGEIEIPGSESAAPQIVAIYPSQDTVPENLLKVYLHFSQPMAEGRSADFVHLLRDGRDTMKGTFLDLQPELWNEEGTILTLWLDPGRIKLDLIPNKELGNPLEKGAHYKLTVGSGWRSKEGVALEESAQKDICVAERDEQSPDVQTWLLNLPAAGTRQSLTIDFGEPLDRLLAELTILVRNTQGANVEGEVQLSMDEQQFSFLPKEPWRPTSYVLVVETRLEDLAGNNLNRLFETDLNRQPNRKEPRAVFERVFLIK